MNAYQLVIIAGVIGFACGTVFGAFIGCVLKGAKETESIVIRDIKTAHPEQLVRELFDRYRDDRLKVSNAK